MSGVSYLVGDLLTGRVLLLAAVTFPAFAAGLRLGSRLFGRAAEATFRRACFGLIAAAAVLGLPVLDPLLR